MRYQEIIPPPPLSSLIECIWVLEGDSGEAGQSQRILPDGTVELVLNYGDPMLERMTDGTDRVQGNKLFVGQMTRPVSITPTGTINLIGARFYAGGTLPFVNHPMNLLTDQIVALDSIGSKLGAIADRVSDIDGLSNRAQSLIEAMNRLVVSDGTRISGIGRIAAQVVSSRGRLSLDYLTRASGLSSRQLQRRFLQEVGIGPKLLSRLLRFQQVFQASSQLSNWASVAAECGYYDQAHLIRDFQQFSGSTPAVLTSELTFLTRAFTRKER